MTKFIRFAVLLLGITVFIASCQKAPFVTVTGPRSYNFNRDGGTQSFAFSCNRDWSVSASDSWVHVSPSSGSASESITVSLKVDENQTEDNRSSTVILKVGDLSETISITQDSPKVAVPKTEYNITKDAQSVEILVKSAASFQVVSEVDWINYQGTKALSSSTIVLMVRANDSFEKRSGVVKIVAGNETSVITINQDTNYGIMVSQNSVALSKEEQTFSITIKSNVDYDVIIPNDALGWLSLAQTKALSENELVFKVSINSSDDTRECVVKVKQKGGDLFAEIKVIQTGAEAVSVVGKYGYDYLLYKGVYYKILSTDNNTVELSYCGEELPSIFAIPYYIPYKGHLLSVASIGVNAFENMASMIKLTIPNSVLEIGYQAFLGCSLKELVLEDGDQAITMSYQKWGNATGNNGKGEGMFYDCPLEALYIGRNIDYDDSWDHTVAVGFSPFRLKENTIKTVVISEKVTHLRRYFLSGCSALTQLTLSDNIVSIRSAALSECGVKEIPLPSHLSEMEHSVLSGSALEKVVIPASLKRLPDYTFNACKNLKEIQIQGLVEIVSMAFAGCSNIAKVYCYTTTPPKFVKRDANDIFSFEAKVFTDATLYVPSESVDAYKAADEWKKFWDIKAIP